MGGDPKSRSQSPDLFHILGFDSIYKNCKRFLRCYPYKISKKLANNNNKTTPKSSQVKSNNNLTDRDTNKQTDHDSPPRVAQASSRTDALHRRRSCDDFILRFSQLSPPDASRRRRQTRQRHSVDGSTTRSLSRSVTRTSSNVILYSNSHGLIKPVAVEQLLDCTLDELCFGCVKKIKVTRDAVTDNGQIREDEELTIKVNPGWRKGTRIKFEGRSEKPRVVTADVIFVVAETKHPLFIRQEDDLELEVELPLIDALTDCTLSVPLLGRQTMSLTIDDIVHPGYTKIIEGQGMPKHSEPRTRGNLVIKFTIKFPEELTEQQRSNAADILQQAC